MRRGFYRSIQKQSVNTANAELEKDKAHPAAQREILRGYANQIRASRDLRHKSFDRNLFGEPAWEILLTLYIIDGDRRRLNTRDLCKHANLALTTVLRWLNYLEQQDLIIRKNNPFDRRVVFVEISDKGRSAMDQYLVEMHAAADFGTAATNV